MPSGRNVWKAILCFGSFFVLTDGIARAGGAAAGAWDVVVGFETKEHKLAFYEHAAGAFLNKAVVTVEAGGRSFSSESPQVIAKREGPSLILAFPGGRRAVFTIEGGGDIALRFTGRTVERFCFYAQAPASHKAGCAMLIGQRDGDKGVLCTSFGRVAVPGARSLYDPLRDSAVTIDSAAEVIWEPAGPNWRVRVQGKPAEPALRISLTKNYYRKTLGIRYFSPRTERPGWERPPVVAMTWYGIEGWKGRPAQRKEWLYPQIDWVAEHLLPYARKLVFQLDDNYPKNDDKYMRELSDYIRSKGLVPGIWFTPFTVAPPEVTRARPEWFIHDKNGKPIKTFGGVSYGGHYTLNVTNEQAVKEWFGAWWRKASEIWNFDFFKIDGQPQVARAYAKAKDGGGVEGYRRGLLIARSIVGPRKFINGCWGIPLEAIGLVDGSRTGPDTGNWPHAINVILRWNFLNNICWWCDPDAAANLFRATVQRARLNAQARVLTGQQFLTDDVWTKVPDSVRWVWQRSFPCLAIRPINLYPIEKYRRYDLFDLKVRKAGRTWDLVGLFNYEDKRVLKKVDLSRLPLTAGKVHVYEFWKGVYIGLFGREESFVRLLDPYEGELFAVVPQVEGKPVLLSTNRHATQGALDLEELSWSQEGPILSLRGVSSHLVAGDSYEVLFVGGGFRLKAAGSRNASGAVRNEPPLCRAVFTPETGGKLSWEVQFERTEQLCFTVSPTQWVVPFGGGISVRLSADGACKWRATSPSGVVVVEPSSGELGPGAAHSKITVSSKPAGLKRGTLWRGEVVFEAQSSKGIRRLKVPVAVLAPPPENLALKASASASSVWGPGYEARRVNDGQKRTRWNSAQGDKEGCWVELRWPEPVEFDTVVIDECTDFGNRIESWRLEASGESPTVIARGKKVGRRYRCTFEKPLKAKKLRLVIEKASVVPTIWEIEVYLRAARN